MPTSEIRRPRRSGLGSEVTTSLRQAIFDGIFRSGDRLGEIEIAQQLDVSRGPVREALLQLRAEGLVSLEMHRGASVVLLSATDIEELTSLRTTLEGFAIELAIDRRTDADIQTLGRIVDQIESAVAEGDVARISQLDVAFHDGIFAAARHTRLSTAWSTIRSQMLLFLLTRAEANRDYLTIVVAEHREILQILQSGDVALARETIGAHARGAYERMIGALEPGERASIERLA